MSEVTYARWRHTLEQARLSVEENWQGRSVAQNPEAALVAYHLAAWWLECGDVPQCRRYAGAALALDWWLRPAVDRLLEWAAVKGRPRRNEAMFLALVGEFEGAP